MIQSVSIVALYLIAYCHAESSVDDSHVWKYLHVTIPFPSNAVQAGWIQDGISTYVGRINNSLGPIPAQILADNETAMFFYFEDEGFKFGEQRTYEILVDGGDIEYSWQRSYDGFYLKGSVHNGGQALTCRVWHNGELLLGQKHSDKKTCYIYDHLNYKLVDLEKYEVLVARPKCHG